MQPDVGLDRVTGTHAEPDTPKQTAMSPALPTPPRRTCFGEPATIAGSGTINGTSGDDVIIGSPSNDAINGLGGDDTICGLAGSDQIAGGLGNDRIDAGEGNDFVRGDVVNFGGSASGGGHDVLYLGPGDDNSLGDSVGLIASGGGNDYISGGDGLDGVIGDSIAFAGDATEEVPLMWAVTKRRWPRRAPRDPPAGSSQRRHGQAMQRCRSRPGSEVRGTQAPRRIYSRQATIGGWDA